MSNPVDEGLKPHLSALVDGELEPLEAIAVQRHARRRPDLASEIRELEHLKLAVHMAGTRDDPAAGVHDRLVRHVEGLAAARAAERTRRRRWMGPLVAAAVAVVAAVGIVAALDRPKVAVETADAPIAMTQAGYDLSDSTLARLVAVHRGEAASKALYGMRQDGVLIAIETLPESFLPPHGGRAPVVTASWQPSALPELACYGLCNEHPSGSTLAVLAADRVELPIEIAMILDSAGVYVDVIDGVELRLSAVGAKLFLLLSDADVVADGPRPI